MHLRVKKQRFYPKSLQNRKNIPHSFRFSLYIYLELIVGVLNIMKDVFEIKN